MDFVFVSHHYDYHLAGLCRVNGKLCEFVTDYPDNKEEEKDPICEVYELSWFRKVKALASKKLFEICVGYHWTYPNRALGARFYYRKPKWLFKLLYKLYYAANK